MEEKIALVLKWLKKFEITDRSQINYRFTSYGLKHIVEQHFDEYIPEDAFVEAMQRAGFKRRKVTGTENTYRFNISTWGLTYLSSKWNWFNPKLQAADADPPISAVVLRCSHIAFYKEQGETYTAIAKRFNLSSSRIQQLVKRHERTSLSNALFAVGARREYDRDTHKRFLTSDNVDETLAIMQLLNQMCEGGNHALQRHV